MPLISSPPKALSRQAVGDDDTAGTPGKSTGAEVTSREGQRQRKKSKRQMHEIKPKKPTPKSFPDPDPEHPVIAYLIEQAKTQEKNDFTFLLWGSMSSEIAPTYAVDVTITDDLKKRANHEEDVTPWISSYGTIRIDRFLREEDVFSLLKRRYYKEIGFFSRYLFFRKIARVRFVNFRIISRTQQKFKVSMDPVDFSCFQKEYDETLAKTHEKMNWGHFEDPDCDEDPDLVQRCGDCGNTDCDIWYSLKRTEEDDCPGRQREAARDKLQWVQNADLLTFYFRNPSLARGENMLSSSPYDLFGQWKYMKYFKTTYQRNWPKQRGLYVETCFNTTRLLYTTLILLVLVTIFGKLAWGSWDVVFGAGSFCVAIPMLVLTALSHSDG